MAKPIYVVGAIILCLLLYACINQPEEAWQLTEVTGHLPDLRFTLIDDNGHAITEQDYRGNNVLLYFGFTGCSSQCPLAMERLSRLMNQLGADTPHVRLLFVSINPANDTPQVLHYYLASFDPGHHITGLTGNDTQIESLAKRYRVAYRSGSASIGESPHSNIIYIFDKTGHARLIVTPEDSDEKILHDLHRLSHDGA